ncbi:lipoprotein signal peptidase [Oleiphilus messinensis]|uniref:Lipoprotein signal peptidase n=1 Tax=Oleiphilus messinensis TaxID=141451 RepID=A0A1Y0I5V3_9GAMM|nr:signal peptidase II [Oleiphilus messinensis]ARU54915.1 lipoprotein signal peptidase [Oleiphilus messinensis]
MWKWLILAAVVFVLDLVTKFYASTSLDYARSVEILPFFNLTLLHNTGAAFSFLASESGWQRWLFTGLAIIVSGVLLRWLYTLKGSDVWLSIAIALVLGGALGNLYDRITLGYVVDFLHFYWRDYHFPAFNLADSAISVGAVMLAVDIFRAEKKKQAVEA